MNTVEKVYLEVTGSESALVEFCSNNKGVLAQRNFDKFVNKNNGFTAYFEGEGLLDLVSSVRWNPEQVVLTIGCWF